MSAPETKATEHWLARVARDLKTRRARRAAAQWAVASAAIVLTEGVVARALVTPDVRPLLSVGLSLPLAAALVAWFRPLEGRRLLAEAGSRAGTGAIFLAARDVPAGARLGPLVRARAEELAERQRHARIPALPAERLARWALPAYFLAVLVLIAPGRRLHPLFLDDATARDLASEAAALEENRHVLPLDRDQARNLTAALDTARDRRSSERDLGQAATELRAVAASPEAMATRLGHALGKLPLLDSVAKELANGRWDLAARELQRVADDLAARGLSPRTRASLAETLSEAARIADDPGLRAALETAGAGLGTGQAADAAHGVVALAERWQRIQRTVEGLERMVITLSPGRGRQGDLTAAAELGPRAPTVPVAPGGESRSPWIGSDHLSPAQRELVSRYFRTTRSK